MNDHTASSVASALAPVPTQSDIALRLSQLDKPALASVVKTNLAAWAQFGIDARTSAGNLREIAAALETFAKQIDEAAA